MLQRWYSSVLKFFISTADDPDRFKHWLIMAGSLSLLAFAAWLLLIGL